MGVESLGICGVLRVRIYENIVFYFRLLKLLRQPFEIILTEVVCPVSHFVCFGASPGRAFVLHSALAVRHAKLFAVL